MEVIPNRAGRFIMDRDGIRTFVPGPIPEIDRIDMGSELLSILVDAQTNLGRLDGASDLLPDPELFVMMYVKKEAVLSSQIEGTQASLMDVLEFEADALDPDKPKDVKEVVNYIRAIYHGIDKIKAGSGLDLELIRELHLILMEGTRGGELRSGEFRKVQNWVGPKGCSIRDAVFVPPPPSEMMRSLISLQEYIGTADRGPPLLRSGLIHSQFESIHPFLDGNGRMGRLLITLYLIKEGTLKHPMLYLSHYLLRNRSGYYDRLQSLRENGDIENWLSFYLKGISEVSKESYEKSLKILELKERGKDTLMHGLGRLAPTAIKVHEALFKKPVVTVNTISSISGLSFQSANKLISKLEAVGILVEVTGQRRNRIYEFKEYMDILNE
ncbi:MAG: Fic family protein [Thermoplasmatota archaeon]